MRADLGAIRAEAYEQAAKWCEERADAMLDSYEKRGRPDPIHAEWVRGCADTIRHKAAALAAPQEGGSA